VIWGYRMWWLRRPHARRRGATGRRPATGVHAPCWWWGLVAVGVGMFLPVLGVTLIAFLAFDVLRQHRLR